MNWKKIKIYCSPQAIELLSAVLMENSITGFIINDPNTASQLYTSEQTNWAYKEDDLTEFNDFDCNIEIYLPDDEQGREMLLNLQTAVKALNPKNFDFELGSLKFEYDEADDTVWLEGWKKHFKPLKIGKTFYIKPSWETISESHNRRVIEMDPANSFGSGTHATTQLCLTAFEKVYNSADDIEVLDLGCGSGILGIGAGLSGVKNITFVDIDLHCTETSKQNAINNNLDLNNLSFHCGNILDDKPLRESIGQNKYHIVFANIMAEILIEMSPVLHEFLSEGGSIILSGIIASRLEAVKSAFIQAEYNIISVYEKDEWCSVVVQLKQ